MKLTAELLDEWRENPLTRALRDALKVTLDAEREALTQGYWAGKPVPEAERQGHLRKVELWEDLFEASAADFTAWLMKDEDDNGQH